MACRIDTLPGRAFVISRVIGMIERLPFLRQIYPLSHARPLRLKVPQSTA
jgi:hypothetical protein